MTASSFAIRPDVRGIGETSTQCSGAVLPPETPEWEGGSPNRATDRAELQTIVREIADWARARGRLRLIDPLRVAPRRAISPDGSPATSSVPDWAVGWGVRWPASRP